MRFFKKREVTDQEYEKRAIVGFVIAGLVGVANFIFGLYCIWFFFWSKMGTSGIFGVILFIVINVVVVFISSLLINTHDVKKN